MTKINAKKLKADAVKRLGSVDSPETDASELIKFVFGLSKTDILLNPEFEAEEEKLALFDSLVKKRESGYPLQYILGEWDFYGFTFAVNEGVLIPRPETEQTAREACRLLKGKKDKVIFDICSGSGCIGLSVAAYNPECRVYLIDISPSAIECAEKNKSRLGLDNALILDYDIFSGFSESVFPRPDAILCNPPYVPQKEYETLEREIFYEPKEAITPGGDGLEFYRCLNEKWLEYLNPGGFFIFESGEGQPEKIIDIISSNFKTSDFAVTTEYDIYGTERFVLGEKRTEA